MQLCLFLLQHCCWQAACVCVCLLSGVEERTATSWLWRQRCGGICWRRRRRDGWRWKHRDQKETVI